MMDETRSLALLRLLSDQRKHPINDTPNLDQSCPAVGWHRLAPKLKRQGLIENSWLKNEMAIIDAGAEIFQRQAPS